MVQALKHVTYNKGGAVEAIYSQERKQMILIMSKWSIISSRWPQLQIYNTYMYQDWNWISITDLDNPLTRLVTVQASAETYTWLGTTKITRKSKGKVDAG